MDYESRVNGSERERGPMVVFSGFMNWVRFSWRRLGAGCIDGRDVSWLMEGRFLAADERRFDADNFFTSFLGSFFPFSFPPFVAEFQLRVTGVGR